MARTLQVTALERCPFIADAFNPLNPASSFCKKDKCIFWEEINTNTGRCVLESLSSAELAEMLATLESAIDTASGEIVADADANKNAVVEKIDIAQTALEGKADAIIADADANKDAVVAKIGTAQTALEGKADAIITDAGTNKNAVVTKIDTAQTALETAIGNVRASVDAVTAAITTLNTQMTTLLGDALELRITAAIDASTAAKEPVEEEPVI